MPARNPMLPRASSEDFAPPPTVFAAEGAKTQQSFPLALLGSGRCGNCVLEMHSLPSSPVVPQLHVSGAALHCQLICAVLLSILA